MPHPYPREQLDIAINGSPHFHAKSASADGTMAPDTILAGHEEMAVQLQGLSLLIGKTAEYVAQGYPAKVALTHLGEQNKVIPEFLVKIAALIDETGEYTLREMVDDAYRQNLADFQAKTKTAQTEPRRSDKAIRRMAQLTGMAEKS